MFSVVVLLEVGDDSWNEQSVWNALGEDVAGFHNRNEFPW